ncbi:MAG: hypothetical protein PHF37_07570, partial [Phycisphaerae bacterium]|nr:hypothetical protein [Phycisphaerae bacterium]
PRLILNLGSKKQAESGPFAVDHVTGDNGIVQLAAAKWKDDEVFGLMKLKCYQFDYNSLGQMFIAKGPGLFALDNSKADDEENKRNKKKISLTKRCYALIENFDVLKYDLINNKIEAGAPTDDFITMNYVPVTDKGNGDATNISAGHINARFISVDNRTELSDVYASEGVSFEDQKNIFSGSELLYNGDESMLYVNGSESMPAMLNNAQVVGIEHNIRTGRTKAKPVGISIFSSGDF